MRRLFGNCNEKHPRGTEHLGEQVLLNEMSTLIDKKYGFGIEIVIHSDDHLPAHMHVNDYSTHKLIAKVLIPLNKPKDSADIIACKGYALTKTQKKVILQALLSNDREVGVPIWRMAKRFWNSLHPDNEIQ